MTCCQCDLFPASLKCVKRRSLKRRCKQSMFMLQQETFILGVSFLTRAAPGKVIHLMGEKLLCFSFCTEQGSSQNCPFCYMFLQKMVHPFLTACKDPKAESFAVKPGLWKGGEKTVCKTSNRNAKC